MAKDKQKKHEAAAGAIGASGKMSGKEFEKELAKLQVELFACKLGSKPTMRESW
jgi:hypothetical protein